MAQKLSQGKKGSGCLKGCLVVIAIPILLLGGSLFFATIQLRQSDKDILKTYQPTPEIADIAEKNTLTDKGKATFYRADPQLVEAGSFIEYCRTQARGVEALACEAPKPGGGPFGGRAIILLKIDDPRFVDHKFAAAAHEMLHIAYSRLSSKERKQINVLLDQELLKHQNDFHLMTVVDILKARKGNVQDELHSKFGIEYSDISSELEDYYKQYFNDRTQVVELFKSGGFNSRVKRMDEISYEIKALTPQLTSMQSQLTAYQNAGDATNFNNLLGQYNSMITQYNTKAAESQKIYGEIQQFYQYFNPDYKPPENKAN